MKNGRKLEVSDKDIFLATSWWTAEAIQKINLRQTFFYILQEVETFFYPHGDDMYRCATVLKNKNIRFILNSKLLSDYYGVHNAEQIHAENSVYFEPAFPKIIPNMEVKLLPKKAKYRLFFYGRPNNSRNMYYTGLQLLDEALMRGIIKKDEWEICFAGSETEALKFSNGVTPIMLGQMNWDEYGSFLKTVDLAFSLMYTPHPSYPPLDVASVGGAVLTNSFENKKTLHHYSKNIVCADLDNESMMKGFIKAVELAKNKELRKKNVKYDGLNRDWEHALEHVVSYMNEYK